MKNIQKMQTSRQMIQHKKTLTSEELEGNVVIDGSGTVFPLMQRIAEEYMINRTRRCIC